MAFTRQLIPCASTTGTLFQPSAVGRDLRANCPHSTRKKPPRAGPMSTPQVAGEAPQRRAQGACTKRRFITFYPGRVKRATLEKTTPPLVASDTEPRRGCKPMVTCQIRLKAINPIQTGVHA